MRGTRFNIPSALKAQMGRELKELEEEVREDKENAHLRALACSDMKKRTEPSAFVTKAEEARKKKLAKLKEKIVLEGLDATLNELLGESRLGPKKPILTRKVNTHPLLRVLRCVQSSTRTCSPASCFRGRRQRSRGTRQRGRHCGRTSKLCRLNTHTRRSTGRSGIRGASTQRIRVQRKRPRDSKNGTFT